MVSGFLFLWRALLGSREPGGQIKCAEMVLRRSGVGRLRWSVMRDTANVGTPMWSVEMRATGHTSKQAHEQAAAPSKAHKRPQMV